MYDAEFGEAEPRGTVTWDVAKILEQSSNVGTIKIAQGIGDDAMYDMQQKFGFGQKSALDFPNEASGAVLTPSKWSGTSLPTIAIGQGISVTPMQILMAYNTIANQGVYVAPKLVQSTTDADGVVHPTATAEGRRVVSQTTADQLNLMLRNVVIAGTGQEAKIDGYQTFGKTGTARKVQPGGKYTDANGIVQYQSTFIGVVPAEQPALSVYVMIDEPRAGKYTGGTTAAPAFKEIASFALRRLRIPPAATDQAAGGTPVRPDGGTPVGVAVVSDDGRVKAPLGRFSGRHPGGDHGAAGGRHDHHGAHAPDAVTAVLLRALAGRARRGRAAGKHRRRRDPRCRPRFPGGRHRCALLLHPW